MSEYLEAELIDPTNNDEVKVRYSKHLIILGSPVLVQGVVYLDMDNMKETDMDSLRIRLIAAVQESEQDQDSESSTRRQVRQVKDGKSIVDNQLGKVKDPLKYGKLVNDGRGIKCNLCQVVLKAYSTAGDTRGTLKRHLGIRSYYKLTPLKPI